MAHIYEIPYQGQIRNYISQFLRIFTGIIVDTELDRDEDGRIDTKQVKVIYANMDRVVSDVLNGDGTFSAASLPIIAGYLQTISRNDEARMAPTHVDSRAYVTDEGSTTSIQRLMPVPYRATMQIAIYSDNSRIKLQILEKILSIFNPDLTFNKNNDVLDWTNIARAELISINNEENQPAGTDGRIIVDTLDFEFDFWLNFPFKETDSGIIKVIEANITDNNNEIAGIDTLTIV